MAAALSICCGRAVIGCRRINNNGCRTQAHKSTQIGMRTARRRISVCATRPNFEWICVGTHTTLDIWFGIGAAHN